MEKEIILVPCDFTKSNDDAILHAVQLARAAKDKILLMHVVHNKTGFFEFGKKAPEEDHSVLQGKLEALADEVRKEHQIETGTLFEEGDIRKSLRDVSKDRDVNLVVMGTHYTFNKKKIDANEVIEYLRSSRSRDVIPVIVVNEPPGHTHYIEIVVPIDYRREFKETLRWVMHLSKYYQCNINFIKPFYSDPEKKRLMANNMYFTKKMLDNNNIVYGIKTAKKQKQYREEVFRFATDIDADLIVIMADRYREYIEHSKNGQDRRQIPIMCIKPLPKKFQQFY